MSKFSSDNNNNRNHTYGLLSDCHTPSPSLENTSIKAPRRIESNYSQFPLQQEPVYANTQSLYDNILYPQSASKSLNRLNDLQEKKSCASQTQLTWTMATFSSFVDLENQSAIIPQPDPTTLYSVVQHHHTYIPPSASAETVEHLRKTSPHVKLNFSFFVNFLFFFVVKLYRRFEFIVSLSTSTKSNVIDIDSC